MAREDMDRFLGALGLSFAQPGQTSVFGLTTADKSPMQKPALKPIPVQNMKMVPTKKEETFGQKVMRTTKALKSGDYSDPDAIKMAHQLRASGFKLPEAAQTVEDYTPPEDLADFLLHNPKEHDKMLGDPRLSDDYIAKVGEILEQRKIESPTPVFEFTPDEHPDAIAERLMASEVPPDEWENQINHLPTEEQLPILKSLLFRSSATVKRNTKAK